MGGCETSKHTLTRFCRRYGKKPFQTMAVKKYIAEIQRGVRLQKPLGCPQPLYAVLLSSWKYDSVERPDFPKIVGQLKAVLGMFPKFVVSDDLWARLGGLPRNEVDAAAKGPIRPKAQPFAMLRSPTPTPTTAAVTNPFDNDDNDDSDDTPGAQTAVAVPGNPRPGATNPFDDEVDADDAAPVKPVVPDDAATNAAPAPIDINPDLAAELGLIIAPLAESSGVIVPESAEERDARHKARTAAKVAEKLRLARAAILNETGVDPGELDFLVLNGGFKKAPPVASKKPKKQAPVVAQKKKKAPPVARKSRGSATSVDSEADVVTINPDAEDPFAEYEVAAEEDEPNNDYSVDLSTDARSRDRKLTFGDSISWTIFAPKPLANTVDRKDAFSIRCARVVQDQVKLKELGENPDPAVYVPLVLRLCTSLEGMMIETRSYVARYSPASSPSLARTAHHVLPRTRTHVHAHAISALAS